MHTVTKKIIRKRKRKRNRNRKKGKKQKIIIMCYNLLDIH